MEQAVAVPGGSSRARAIPMAITLLIVEDQDTMRRTLRRFLRLAFPDWVLFEAADGAAALVACAEQRPDVVLMDIMLPDADGIALTVQVRAILPGSKVIFVSYLGGETHIARALAAGGSAYVMKDRLFSDLIPAITRALDADPSAAGRPDPD
jgi:two-component system, NarL family, response regulator DesR